MIEEIPQKEQKIENPVLFGALEELTNAFVEALDKPFVSSYGSWFDRVKVLVQGDTELVAKILEKRPDLEEKKLSQCLVSIEKCLKVLLKEKIRRNPPHASTEEEYRDELAFFLEKLLTERERSRRVFATIEGLSRHFKRIFREEYLRYEKYLYSESVCDFLVGQFQNFTCTKSIELDGQLSIREIRQEEFHSLVEVDERYGYRLESYPEFILHIPIKNRSWAGQLTRLITALRLLKKERIGLARIYYAFALPCRSWKIVDAPIGTEIPDEPEGSSFDFSESDEEKLKLLWRLLGRAEVVGYLNTSMRRLNFAYERERPEDRWIDYFISLESLYSKGDELTEVTHRLATRLSRALTDGLLEEKTEFRRKIKRWYIIRSKIVHGIQTDLTAEQLQDLEEVLRRSLKWFMSHEDFDNHDKIIDSLDLGS